MSGQLGLESTPDEYVGRMVDVFREVRRVLRDDGTAWVNLGDSYAQSEIRNRNGKGGKTGEGDWAQGTWQTGRKLDHGLKLKDLIGIPWRVALALQADGWYLRSDIIWHKPNPMPESVRDRPTKSHEYLFLLSKNERYYFDADAVSEPVSDWSRAALASDWQRRTDYGTPEVSGRNSVGQGYADRVRKDGRRNIRTVWTIATKPYKGAHFATFPPKLVEPCVKAGCPEGGTVLDPFAGSGTTGAVATQLGRSFVGIDLNPAYLELARQRIANAQSALATA